MNLIYLYGQLLKFSFPLALLVKPLIKLNPEKHQTSGPRSTLSSTALDAAHWEIYQNRAQDGRNT